MVNPQKIGIVTVLYNSETVLKDFFESLDKQQYRNFVLYVIDNKSPDHSLALVHELTEETSFQTVVIENEDNYGVAKANNIGIERAIVEGCGYVLLSNNDTVLEPDTIGKLINGLQRYGADIAVPKIYYYGTDMLWAAGGKFTWYNGSTKHYGAKKKDKGKYNKPAFIDYSPTCFMLIKADVFIKTGFMDEKYFVYYDDTDFIWRCRKKGLKLLYYPESRLWHKESTSTGGQQSDFVIYYMERNRVYFTEKNFPLPKKKLVNFYLFLHNKLRKPFTMEKTQLKLALRAQADGKKLIKQ